MEITLKPIGTISSPYHRREETPYQAYLSDGIGQIEVFKQYEKGLQDIEEFSHIIIVYYFHKAKGYSLLVRPPWDGKIHGVFAVRGANRPNAVGVSIVRLIERKDNILKIAGTDALDGTPLIDIKPYVPRFDQVTDIRIGWLEGKIKKTRGSDG
jgi:tRNA-Thr(GGU) m(6)t(6)A37 methyltransferase TsaA